MYHSQVWIVLTVVFSLWVNCGDWGSKLSSRFSSQFIKQTDGLLTGRSHLDDQSEVESLGHEDCDGQGRLLSRLGCSKQCQSWPVLQQFVLTRQIEHQDWQVENPNTGNNQVHDVEQRLAPDF